MFGFSVFHRSAFFSGTPKAFASGWRSDEKQEIYSPVYLRHNRDLPFYCKPVNLFAISWTVMLVALSFHISYDSYPQMDIPLILFGTSLIAFLCGYWWMRFHFKFESATLNEQAPYRLNVSKLRKLSGLFVLLATAIMLLNLKLEGWPPIFGLFSFDTKSYLEYGRFRQILFPLLVTIVVNSFLDPSRWRKLAFSAFGIGSMLVYITRGEILSACLQSFFVFSMTTRLSKKKLFVAAGFVVLGLTVLADVIGSNRTTQTSFLEILQIRREFWEWPMLALWVLSYFSIPLSDLSWMVRSFHWQNVAWASLSPLLPGFWTPSDPHELFILGNRHVIDGAHTYLVSYYLDFSFAGVLLANFALGIACAILVRRGISRYFLTSAVFLGCLAYIFFTDKFTPLSTLLQFAMQAFVMRYILSAGEENPSGGRVPVVA